MTTITAAIIIIGNEILSGRTKEANMLWLSGELKAMGIQLNECSIVRDEEADIVAAINRLRAQNDYVFTSGGIGPTHDDITSASVAAAFGVEIHRHPEAERLLRNYYEPDQQTDARMKMSEVPLGATLVPNPVSTAPGYKMENVFVMAGVPKIFQAMFQQIRPTLKGGDIALNLTITAYVREGDIATPLSALQDRFPEVEIGSYPFLKEARFGAQLVFTSTAEDKLKQSQAEAISMLEEMKIEYSLD
ncbi:MAG: competence/damage-inducible protein A [Rickettsiales bacterium]|nr:competence/damage-inducible protein A [Rickettsiales bacterium]